MQGRWATKPVWWRQFCHAGAYPMPSRVTANPGELVDSGEVTRRRSATGVKAKFAGDERGRIGIALPKGTDCGVRVPPFIMALGEVGYLPLLPFSVPSSNCIPMGRATTKDPRTFQSLA